MMNDTWPVHPVTPVDLKPSARHVSELPLPTPLPPNQEASPTTGQLSEAILDHPVLAQQTQANKMPT